MEQVEKLMDRFLEKFRSLEADNLELIEKAEESKRLLQEKDLELIRLRKESQRLVEQAEREKMSLQKERQQVETRLAGLLDRLGRVSGQLTPENQGGVSRK